MSPFWLISPYCHIYVSINEVNIGWGNGLSSIRRQAIIKTNSGLLSIGALGTNLREILINQNTKLFIQWKYIWKYCLQNGCHFVQGRCVNGAINRQQTFQSCYWFGMYFLSSDNIISILSGDKMATIFQTTFSNAFSWMKIYELIVSIKCWIVKWLLSLWCPFE